MSHKDLNFMDESITPVPAAVPLTFDKWLSEKLKAEKNRRIFGDIPKNDSLNDQ